MSEDGAYGGSEDTGYGDWDSDAATEQENVPSESDS